VEGNKSRQGDICDGQTDEYCDTIDVFSFWLRHLFTFFLFFLQISLINSSSERGIEQVMDIKTENSSPDRIDSGRK
jgi:hypothetical protein